MSESIKHECGIALLRLKKPLSYFKEKYGTQLFGLNKLYLLMEKQHNRGQDGSGVAVLNQKSVPGVPYINRNRSTDHNSIQKIFDEIMIEIQNSKVDLQTFDEDIHHIPYLGQIYLGHLRYGTHGRGGIEFCHPFIRQSNFKHQTVVMAGNFNLTNNDDLLKKLQDLGQHPRNNTDTVTVLEQVAYQVDEESNRVKRELELSNLSPKQIIEEVSKNIDFESILSKAVKEFDGGYAMAGFTGNGTSFVLRDPNGIRPAFWYENEEMVVVTSERPPIKTAFSVDYGDIKEIPRGAALIIDPQGNASIHQIQPQREEFACSFERIYFSRGTDRDIYLERKNLGKLLIPQVLKSIENDIQNSIFSYIPNTAEVAFMGMMDGLHSYLNHYKMEKIKSFHHSDEELEKLLSIQPRMEKIAVKDTKLRTFITNDDKRGDLVNHVYDTTYGIVNNHVDNLVIIDDSIVRGTTLKNSILRILDRLKPKKIIIVSSAPQIRYPDCYGIDMSRLGEFVAFKAAIEMLKERGKEETINDVYELCKQDLNNPECDNHVKMIYQPFSDHNISHQIAKMLKTSAIHAEVEVIYQTVDALHQACPSNKGDWYFTGNYPTKGGNRVANKSFINYFEGSSERAY